MLLDAIDRMNLAGIKVKFLDLGANIGYYSLLAAKYSESVYVTAIDASTFHSALLAKSLELNKDVKRRVEVYNVALSSNADNGKVKCLKMQPNNFAFTAIGDVISSLEAKSKISSNPRLDMLKRSNDFDRSVVFIII